MNTKQYKTTVNKMQRKSTNIKNNSLVIHKQGCVSG